MSSVRSTHENQMELIYYHFASFEYISWKNGESDVFDVILSLGTKYDAEIWCRDEWFEFDQGPHWLRPLSVASVDISNSFRIEFFTRKLFSSFWSNKVFLDPKKIHIWEEFWSELCPLALALCLRDLTPKFPIILVKSRKSSNRLRKLLKPLIANLPVSFRLFSRKFNVFLFTN